MSEGANSFAPSKKCTRCGEEKLICEFRYRNRSSGSDARISECLKCSRSRCRDVAKKYNQRFSEEISKKRKQVYAQSEPVREAAKARSRKRYCEQPEVIRAYERKSHLRTAYGLTLEKYDQMLSDQRGKCAICETSTPGGMSGRFHVDHCHQSGRIRGLLCTKCNSGLGMFKDRVELIVAAIAYLKSSQQSGGNV